MGLALFECLDSLGVSGSQTVPDKPSIVFEACAGPIYRRIAAANKTERVYRNLLTASKPFAGRPVARYFTDLANRVALHDKVVFQDNYVRREGT
jgi:hypothetical protein